MSLNKKSDQVNCQGTATKKKKKIRFPFQVSFVW